MLLAAAALAVLDATGGLTPATLLGLLFVIGVGGALSASTWQTLQPELVPLADRPQAIALGSVNQNLARAVGPAIGGVLLAATSAAAVFLANAVSFLAVLGAVAVTAIPARAQSLPREHVAAAVRSGGRFVVNSPTLLAPYRSGERVHLPRGCDLGVAAAGSEPPARARFRRLRPTPWMCRTRRARRGLLRSYCETSHRSSGHLRVGLSCTRRGRTAARCLSEHRAGGGCSDRRRRGPGSPRSAYWGRLIRASCPRWVKSRGVSYYLVAFQGANAVGALVLGGIAEANSVSVALGVVAASLTVVAAATWRLALPPSAAGTPMSEVPLPMPDLNPPVEDGPVVITVRYHVRPGQGCGLSGSGSGSFDAPGVTRVRRIGTCIGTSPTPTCSRRCSSSAPGRSTNASTSGSRGANATSWTGSTICCNQESPAWHRTPSRFAPPARSRGGSLSRLGTVPRHRNLDAGAALLGSVLDLTADTGAGHRER